MRELANIVERLGILHAGSEIRETHVREVLAMSTARPDAAPAAAAGGEARVTGGTDSLTGLLDAYERELIAGALTAAAGNVAEAARRLQTDRPNLYRRMRRLGITAAVS